MSDAEMDFDLGKMRISRTDRRAIAKHYGKPGLASFDDIRQFVRELVSSTLDDMREAR